ncbi:MAG: hypothetical protein JW967_02215 [Dehalococcoidales bacterium]|nr:hypothetical protein [Dehalococcoidales bacterium]
MRVTIPQMGNLYIPVTTLFRELNVDMVMPPMNSQRTMSLGTKYSPEGLCIPFKLTLGNFIEAAELGADTFIMASGYNTCRLGIYAKTQEKILQNLGYQMEMIEMGVSEKKFAGFLKMVKRLANNAPWQRIFQAFRFGIAKMDITDKIEREMQSIRAREAVKGTAFRTYNNALKAIDEADSMRKLKMLKKDYLEQLGQIPLNGNKQPLKVCIVGEFYVVLEPFSNLDVENELGKLGVEVTRSLYISEWLKFGLFFGVLKKFRKDKNAILHEAAMPYLKRDIGGEGWETVGHKVLGGEHYEGLVHLAPFTCMPEIVAQNIMSSTKENIPVLTLFCDEQMGKPGMLTRVEAFVDLLKRRREKYNN